MEFTLETSTSGRSVLGIKGDLDLYSQKELREYYANSLKGRNLDLILDMEQVGYLDSSGVGILIHIYQMQKSSGRDLFFINMQTSVLKVIQLTRLDQVLKIYKTLEDIPASAATARTS